MSAWVLWCKVSGLTQRVFAGSRWRSRRQRGPARDAEERVGFLDDTDEDDVDVGVAPGAEREMSEVRSGTLV